MRETERSLWHSKLVSLADEINFTGKKPHKEKIRGKLFEFTRANGWKRLYEQIVGELYRINPKFLQDSANGQTEFIISDEPVLWSVEGRGPAQTYDDSWWTLIDNNIYIYTKNNTNKKIELLRRFFDMYGIEYAELKILIY